MEIYTIDGLSGSMGCKGVKFDLASDFTFTNSTWSVQLSFNYSQMSNTTDAPSMLTNS